MKERELYEHARNERIPAAVQLQSKLPERHAPGQWPAYSRKARGIDIWDIDDNVFHDWSAHGIGAVLLGYRDDAVTQAVVRCVEEGSFSFLNPPEEVELADLLCELHPWAENVRFARSGGEIATIAVRIARATTQRSKVAICGYHGWHDWYLSANLGSSEALRGHLLPGLNPLGVPRELRGTSWVFGMNDQDAFDQIITDHGDDLACVIMEPCRYRDPAPGFLEHVRDEAHRTGALLIYDEITIGWRRCLGGAHLLTNVNPDMATFAKSLGNGHPIAAVIGTRTAMDGAHESFISSTYWSERVGPVAALATLKKMQQVDVPAHVADMGRRIREVWQHHQQKFSLPISFPAYYDCFPTMVFEHELAAELKLLMIQEMLQRGFMAGTSVYVTLAHNEENLQPYARAIGETFSVIANALRKGDIEDRLQGPLPVTGFQRLL